MAILGAGWFGCHLALTLQQQAHSVRVFEKTNRVFGGASGNNQNRLHLGYHYPRSTHTRRLLLGSFQQFTASFYARLSRPIQYNIYAVSAHDSLLDFGAYCSLLHSGGLPINEVDTGVLGLSNVEGSILCDERLMLSDSCAEYFSEKLAPSLEFGHEVKDLQDKGSHVLLDGDRFDLCLNCTNNHFQSLPYILHEFTIMLEYDSHLGRDIAVTVMDGPFFSLFPSSNHRYTLSAVSYTPVKRGALTEVQEAARSFSEHDAQVTRQSFEDLVVRFLPRFHDEFQYRGCQKSFKTKIQAVSADARELVATSNGRIITLSSGKLSDVFSAEAYVQKQLNKWG